MGYLIDKHYENIQQLRALHKMHKEFDICKYETKVKHNIWLMAITILLGILIFNVAGCSTARPAAWPGVDYQAAQYQQGTINRR